RIADWLDERTGLKGWWRAKKELPIPAHVNFLYCFGGISLTIIILQVLTGVFMIFFYTPKPQEALNSITYMSENIPLGWLARNMHRWGATLLVATVFTHMITVFYHRAYRRPRELNWLTGIGMFIIVLLFSITGTILPWDWRGYWVLVIWTDYVAIWPIIGEYLQWFMLEGFTVGRSFITHIWLLPALTIVLLAFHFKMVKRHGISGPL
ncbi:MAG: cytochrome b N-terminal domain-containing protein, partial [Deltaproteobacteria bacterium]|nr:cytochrome b N-terminal domain-containing protein [Deltaproteobacteria bacterium]